MLRQKFTEIVTETAAAGWQRGIELFLEELNSDLERDTLLQQSGGWERIVEGMIVEAEQQSQTNSQIRR